MTDLHLVADRIGAARARISAAGGLDVALLAVTKGFGPEAIVAAAAAGCTMIGENYAQELLGKLDTVSATGVGVHFIGRLQSNKIRSIAGVVATWESVDRAKLVDELARRCPGAQVLVQVAAAKGERGKGGCPPTEVPRLVEYADSSGLHVTGLMAVGPTDGGAEASRPTFRLVRQLADELGLAECSMGMTADLEVAVEEGSTQVRLGTALFGPR